MNFYLVAILSACLVIIPAVVSFRKDDKDKFRRIILSVSVTGALLAFFTSFNSNNESLRNKIIAKTNDSLYKSLLNKNLTSAYTILDSINTANRLLNKQLHVSSGLQKSVISSENKLLGNLKEVNNQITGGDNAPKLNFAGNNAQLECDIINHGKFPIRNLSVSLRITKLVYFTKSFGGGFRSDDPRASTLFDKDFGDLSINTVKNIFNLAGSDCSNIRGFFDIQWLNGSYDGWFFMHYEGSVPVFDKFCIYRHSTGLDLKNEVVYNGKYFAEILPLK